MQTISFTDANGHRLDLRLSSDAIIEFQEIVSSGAMVKVWDSCCSSNQSAEDMASEILTSFSQNIAALYTLVKLLRGDILISDFTNCPIESRYYSDWIDVLSTPACMTVFEMLLDAVMPHAYAFGSESFMQ